MCFCHAAYSTHAQPPRCTDMSLVVLSLACSGQQSRCHRLHRRTRHPQTCTGTGGHATRAGRCAPHAGSSDSGAERHRLGMFGVTTPASGSRTGRGPSKSKIAMRRCHLLMYLPSVRRLTICNTASPGTDSLGVLLLNRHCFPGKHRRPHLCRCSEAWYHVQTLSSGPSKAVQVCSPGAPEQRVTARFC